MRTLDNVKAEQLMAEFDNWIPKLLEESDKILKSNNYFNNKEYEIKFNELNSQSILLKNNISNLQPNTPDFNQNENTVFQSFKSFFNEIYKFNQSIKSISSS